MKAPARGGPTALPALPPLVAVLGATASGKSALALALAEACGGEIVNTDSVQVYRYFDIGTAKATAEERARVPHHLIDVAEPDEAFSAGRYEAAAREAIAGIAARGHVPILCGGTGLYYRALVYGLAAVPAVPAAVQRAVEARLAEQGAAALHAALARVDAAAAAAIHPNDPTRIVRALAVYEASGQPLSAYRAAQPFRESETPVLAIAVRWERGALYARIDARVHAMLGGGWIEEVRGLLARGYGSSKPMGAIGYREIAQWLDEGGHGPREALEDAIALRTRHYAKRQGTWFRKHPEVRWAAPGAVEESVVAVRKFLLTQGRPR